MIVNGNDGEIKDFESGIKKTQFNDDKMIQKVVVDLNDETITRLLNAEKYPLIGLKIEENTFDQDFSYGDKEPNLNTTTTDYTKSGLSFLAAKSYKNKKLVVDIMAVFVCKVGNSYSVGLYYLPEGKLENIAFLARVCYHGGSNEHINTDGTVIGPYDIHEHKITEEYIKHCIENFKDPLDLIIKVQSADATVIEKNVQLSDINIQILVNHAKQNFNISETVLDLENLGYGEDVEDFIKIKSEIEVLDAIEQEEKNNDGRDGTK